MDCRRYTRVNVHCLVAAMVVMMFIASGCASTEPAISGFGFGSTRSVSVGETFEIRLPVGENGNRLWRITSYDSHYLTLAGNTRTQAGAKGSREIVVPVLARQSGDTTIELTQRITAQDRLAGKRPKVKTFTIHISP